MVMIIVMMVMVILVLVIVMIVMIVIIMIMWYLPSIFCNRKVASSRGRVFQVPIEKIQYSR